MPRKFDFLSPGIEIREVDQSILPAEVDADGPIIIGRFRKGPGMKPAKVRSLEYFLDVYGNPVPGGSSLKGDIWRDGPQLSAPTYAAYAAQSWLASRTSPVNVVRLLGDQHPQAVDDSGYAGWKLNTSIPTSAQSTNSSAYGLFIVDKGTNAGVLTFRSLTFVGGIGDTDTVTINDGVSTRTFEFDNNDSISGNVKVTMTGGSQEHAAALAAAIEADAAAGNLKVVVSYDSGTAVVKVATLQSSAGSIASPTGAITEGTQVLTARTGDPNEGTLAAIFYANTGYLQLYGQDSAGNSAEGANSTLIKSNDDNLAFTIRIFDASSATHTEEISFNFNRTDGDYIRNKFNTNPQLVNSAVTKTEDLKTYWLGESFERSLKDKVTSSTSGEQYGVLIPLHKGAIGTKTGNWSYHKTGSAEAKSGYLIGRNYGASSAYVGESTSKKLFRFECIHAGEEVQKNVLIGIEELKLATNETVYPYGTFTVKIMDLNGGVLEKYSSCNLDPNSPNFVARRIGDMYMEWNDNDRRYRSYGNHPNVSDYVRIKMFAEEQNYDSTDLPVGFLGPGRPKGFGAVEGDTTAKSFDLSADFSGAFVAGAGQTVGDSVSSELIAMDGTHQAVKFSFPSLPLRVSGSDGFSSNPYKVYFGIRPKVDKDSSLHDNDYVDYLRPLPKAYAGQQFEPSGDFEHSFVFSLHDIVTGSGTTVYWQSGSHVAGTAYTAQSGKTIGNLFDLGVKQFALPLFGGFDGLDITEKEPFRQALITENLSETTNYLQYSLNKAIDSVSDPEAVPANLIAIPGIKNSIITTKIIRTAEARKDVLAVVDLVGDYTPSYESLDSQSTRLGSVSDTITNLKNRQLDSSYAAAYFPAVQIQDNLNNGERVWVPSSVAGLGAMAQSEARSELWFAPAGFNRGGLGNLGGRSGPRVIQARQRLDSSERDRLYEVNINPIATFPNEGVVIFGQKTLQQTPSALDRINVRRLMIFLKAEISKVARGILFDNNVRSTWARFTSQAEPILADVKAKFGLTDYRLILDSSTTTADLIDRNIMYAKVFLKPARAIEYIAIDFVITRTGADFA